MQKRKPHAATIRLDADLYERVETLARADRRPIANFLTLIIADALDGQPGRSTSAGSSAAAA
jgi:predicted transcriptional regulator